MTREELTAYVRAEYGIEPDYPWDSEPEYSVLRHPGSRKWFAVLMRVASRRLGLPGDGMRDIVDLKCSGILMGSLLKKPGYLPGWHMNKNSWLTVLLDDGTDEEELKLLLSMSYDATAEKPRRTRKGESE